MIRLERIEISELPRNLPWIVQLLAPLVVTDPHRTMEQVRKGLFSGEMGLATVHIQDGAGLVIVEPVEADGKKQLWLPYIVGEVRGGPKRFLRMMRAVMAHFETVGRAAGCAEIYIGGRDWSRVFPDFEPYDGVYNGLRKAIA